MFSYSSPNAGLINPDHYIRGFNNGKGLLAFGKGEIFNGTVGDNRNNPGTTRKLDGDLRVD
jgi:hypothetical protein